MTSTPVKSLVGARAEVTISIDWWARALLLGIPVEMSGTSSGVDEARSELGQWINRVVAAGGEETHRCITANVSVNGHPLTAVDVEGYR